MKPEKCLEKVFYKKEILIESGIGYFNDEFIDSIIVSTNIDTNIYEVVPIDNKFAIPRFKDGIVTVMFQKYTVVNKITIKTDDLPNNKCYFNGTITEYEKFINELIK